MLNRMKFVNSSLVWVQIERRKQKQLKYYFFKINTVWHKYIIVSDGVRVGMKTVTYSARENGLSAV